MLLHAQRLSVRVLNLATIIPLDEAAILSAAQETGAQVTVEEAPVRDNLGGAEAELTSAHHPVPVERVGFPGFVPTGSIDLLFASFGLTATGITIDQGTTNTKALPVDETGHLLARASDPHDTFFPRPGWAKQSADALWASVRQAIAVIVAQAGSDAIAFRIADAFEAMQPDIGHPLVELLADGGAAANDHLMHVRADLPGRPVVWPDQHDVGALGVAAMALAALDIKAGMSARSAQRFAQRFAPTLPPDICKSQRVAWAQKVATA